MPSWEPARSASNLRHGAQRVLFESCSATAASVCSTLTALFLEPLFQTAQRHAIAFDAGEAILF
jgi:hypothetical protein